MPYIHINGERFYYAGEITGPGLPVIFCHGSGGSHRRWLFQLQGLQNIARPLAVDLPGHGLSQGSPFDNIAGYREWLHNFTAALNLESFVLAGHSMGGAVALDYALHYPGKLSGLVLVGTGARLRVHPAIMNSFREGKMPPGIGNYPDVPDGPSELSEAEKRKAQQSDPAVYLADFTACDRFDVMTGLSRIEQPALVICGSEDQMTPLKYSRYLEQHLPRARMVEVAGAGHMVMLEAPKEVNAAISDFLKEIAPGCRPE